MALNTLTLSTDTGYVGRLFSATISGATTGSTVEAISQDGTQGFYVLKGKLLNDALPYSFNAVTLREMLPGTGTKDTALTVTGYSIDNPAPQDPVDGTAIVSDGDALAITNSAGGDAHDATVAINGNDITGIRLAATVTMVDNAAALAVPVSGTYTDTATISVANGVITAIALS